MNLQNVLRPKNMLSTAAAALVFYGGIANVSSAKDVGSIKSDCSGGIITDSFNPKGGMERLVDELMSNYRRSLSLNGSAYRSMLEHKKRLRALPPADIPNELEERRNPALKERSVRHETPAIKPYPTKLRAKELHGNVLPPKEHVFAAYDPGEEIPKEGEWVFVSRDLAKRLQKVPYRAAPEEAWSLKRDLGKYRLYALKQGSRDSGESLGKSLSSAGLAIEDGINIFTIGYASERGLQFRGNDGKSPFFHLEKVVEGCGETIEDILLLLYAGADAVVLDSLPDPENEAYKDNHPLVRLPVCAGRAIGDAWKTTKNVGNTPTWGYWDNVTGSAGMCFVGIVETGKHGGEAVTNLPRVPVRLIFGENEHVERIQDWVFLVPLEYLSNVIEMEGIHNMENYKIAFGEKGVIGSTAEMVGSGFVVGKSVYKLIDEH